MPMKLADEILLEKASMMVKIQCCICIVCVRCLFYDSHSLGLECKVRGNFHVRLFRFLSPIANKYHEGKMKRTLKRKLKVLEIVELKADVVTRAWQDCCA